MQINSSPKRDVPQYYKKWTHHVGLFFSPLPFLKTHVSITVRSFPLPWPSRRWAACDPDGAVPGAVRRPVQTMPATGRPRQRQQQAFPHLRRWGSRRKVIPCLRGWGGSTAHAAWLCVARTAQLLMPRLCMVAQPEIFWCVSERDIYEQMNCHDPRMQQRWWGTAKMRNGLRFCSDFVRLDDVRVALRRKVSLFWKLFLRPCVCL